MRAMKIRIHGNSIRTRLTQTEVECLAAGKAVEQTTSFSEQVKLVCSVRSGTGLRSPSVTFDGTNLTVVLPPDQIDQWATSDQVGIYAELETGCSTVLRLLIEKDFECLHSQSDTTADAYPNPRAL